jgi:heterotetrameric sarcosine oxidase gamma subunit
MHETATLRHGLEDTAIRNLVAEEKPNVLITHQPFTSKLLAKGIHWNSTIEDSIQAVFGVSPEQGRVISGSPWSAMSWGTNEYLMTNKNTSSVREFLDSNQPSEGNGMFMVDLSSAYQCFRISGSATIDLITSSCFLDVQNPDFSVSSVTACRLGPYRVVIHHVSDPAIFDMYIERSLATPFVGYLVASGYPFKVSYSEP